jgi:ATP-dependent RNA helicase DeaD
MVKEQETTQEKILFSSLNMKESVLNSINDLKFESPTEIQAVAIPVAMEGFDMIGQAQTGTGKTIAFGAPILSRMAPSNGKVQAVIMAPTRELAVQVSEELAKISKYDRTKILAIYGGQSIDRQIMSLRRGVDIVVGTPGRILDHISRKTLKLESANFLVLDEADEMLNMGFIEDIETIMSHLNTDRQTLLFSATMPKAIRDLTKKYMKEDTKHINVNKKSMTVTKTSQHYFEVNFKNKFETLCRILDIESPKCCIMFCKTKAGVDELVEQLMSKGFIAEGMHGDMKQAQRQATLKKFKSGNLNYLIATDVAARGIDVDDVTHVINYDLPQEVESYVHRIGRTGRANKEGIAYSLINRREALFMRQIERETKSTITKKPIPSVADIFVVKSQAILDFIKITLEEDLYESFMPMASKLTKQYGADEVAASLIKIIFDKEVGSDYGKEPEEVAPQEYSRPESDFSNRSSSRHTSRSSEPSKSSVRLFMTAGRMDKINTGDVLRFICDKAEVVAEEVGQIDVLDKFTFVDVPESVVDSILRSCDGVKLKNRIVKINVAKYKR